MKNSISMREANRLLRSVNPRRSFGDGSSDKFALCSTRLLEEFSRLIEVNMDKPPNSGEGCRVQPMHIANAFTLICQCIENLITIKESLEDE
jgi:hypothetical protein